MTSYTTNPDKRCIYCDGREVIAQNDDGSIATNLRVSLRMNRLVCRDRDECRQNVEAENTHISFYGDDKGITKKVITKNGRMLAEIEAKEGERLW